MTMLRAGGLLDVLTPLSDCRQESVEKMERKILGGSYLYWICTTGFYVVGFCVLVNFSLFSGYHAEGYHDPPVSFPAITPRATTPHRSLFRLPRRGLPRPTGLFSGYHAEGCHARTDITFKLTGYHVSRVTTPELPRSIQTSGYMRVITPAGRF